MRLLRFVLADALEALANDVRSGGGEAALTLDGVARRIEEPTEGRQLPNKREGGREEAAHRNAVSGVGNDVLVRLPAGVATTASVPARDAGRRVSTHSRASLADGGGYRGDGRGPFAADRQAPLPFSEDGAGYGISEPEDRMRAERAGRVPCVEPLSVVLRLVERGDVNVCGNFRHRTPRRVPALWLRSAGLTDGA